jgi:hypothetical protein
MVTIIAFQCPNTGLRVRGLAEGDGFENDDTCEAIVCSACRQFHLVNLKTGKIVGDDDD